MLQPWYKPWASKSTLREVIGLFRDAFTTATELIDDLPPGTFSKQDAQRADFLIDDDGEVFVSELSELQKFFLEFELGEPQPSTRRRHRQHRLPAGIR
jgi:iron complex transport system ATP-binding protein